MGLKEFIDKHPLSYTVSIVVLTAGITWGVFENVRLQPLKDRLENYEKGIGRTASKSNIIRTNVIQTVKVDSKEQIKQEIQRRKDEYTAKYSRLQKNPPDTNEVGQIFLMGKEPSPEEKAKEEEDSQMKQEGKEFVGNIRDLAESIKDVKTIKWCEERLKRLSY